ncbi:phosphatidylinositol-glycan biosynthesis class F protein isoform X3 [Scyliorhinus canicula]|uniref:phosphatidylinositol-glycan biosynthesis class F protein isoform X3 n=1 Tax=Scyliorhinus canicula TaxID=7830 RepID=UPI0018F35C6F|nr:phosphatidylinositol-glycan biosynthesis class F protein isoform X3 [Scyliorhinus canicula]
MKDVELRGMFSAHIILILSIVASTLVPPLFLEDFSVMGTHLLWLCICSGTVAAITIVLYSLLPTNTTSGKMNSSTKVTKIFRSCLLFFTSCLIFHGIIVLYGAPLLVSFRETFLFAVLLSTFTTLRCLCMLGPNVQAWIRVFSKNGCGQFPVHLEQRLDSLSVLSSDHYGYIGTRNISHTNADDFSSCWECCHMFG